MGSVEARAGGALDLSDGETRHLERMLRGEQRFFAFVYVDLLVALALVGYFAWVDAWSGARIVVILLVLLSARAHLRQVKSARLLRRFSERRGSPG
jgi:hypothetical protein